MRPRILPFVIGMALLAIAAIVSLVLRFGMERGAPAGVVSRYAEAAAAGDIGRLRELGVASKVDSEQEILGRAYSDRVELALLRAVVVGAQDAYRVHQDYTDVQVPLAMLALRDEDPAVEDRGRWVIERALAALPAADRAYFILKTDADAAACDARPLAPAVQDLTPTSCLVSTWKAVVARGADAWADLSYRRRQQTEPGVFFALYGAPNVGEPFRNILLEGGARQIKQNVLAPAPLQSRSDDGTYATVDMLAKWLNNEAFVKENGERLLIDAYKSAYGSGALGDVVVEKSDTQGMLFHSSFANVRAQAAAVTVAAGLSRTDDGWRIDGISDLNVQVVARELCSAPPIASSSPERAGRDALEYDGDSDPRPWTPSDSVEDAVRAIDATCAWEDVQTTQYAPVSLASAGMPAEDGLWSKAILAVTTATLLLLMLWLTRSRKLDAPKINLEDGETLLDSLETNGRFVRGRLTLTTRRVILQRVHWWLTTTSTTMVALARIESAGVSFGMVWIWVFLGVALLPVIAPAAVLVLLYALVSSQVRLTFGASGREHKFRLTGKEAEARAGVRFVGGTFRQQLKLAHGVGGTTDLLDPDPVPGSYLPSAAWGVVLAMMALTALQIGLAGSVDFESGMWLAALVALPAWVGARYGGLAGGLVGIFGAVGVFAVLQPSPYTGMFSVGQSADWMVIVGTILAFFVTGALFGQGQGALRVAAACLIGSLLWWFLPELAGAPVAGSLDWVSQCLRVVGAALAASSFTASSAAPGNVATTGAIVPPSGPLTTSPTTSAGLGVAPASASESDVGDVELGAGDLE